MTSRKHMSAWQIFMMIFKISAFTLGGGPVLIGIIKGTLDRTKVVSEEESSDMLSLSLASPGALGISMSYQTGLALGGPAGALAGVIGMALPPFLAILLISSWLLANMGSGYISAFFSGAAAALVVVLGAVVWKLAGKNVIGSVKDVLLALFVAGLSIVFDISPVCGLLGGTVLGVAVNLAIEKHRAASSTAPDTKGE